MAKWAVSGPSAGLSLTDDQVLALAKLLHTMTTTNMLAFHSEAEYHAYIGAVARIDAVAEDIINDSRAGRR